MAIYGLIGKRLSHSFSKIIHEYFTNLPYEHIELNQVDSFLKDKSFSGINVTIPYKKTVIPYIDTLSHEAEAIGVVNTIVRKKNKLYGYNTDYFGLKTLLEFNGISLRDKSILILGNGSTSRTIEYLAQQSNAKDITIAARHPYQNQVHFSTLLKDTHYQIIFNATPVGMSPNIVDSLPIDLEQFSNLESVVDVIYNPLMTPLLQQAKSLNLTYVNGLLMLVMQAIKAIELFHHIVISKKDAIAYYELLLKKQLNIVLIGMPMSGKSLYGSKLATLLNKKHIDIDHEIETQESLKIENIFTHQGEPYFRQRETEVVLKTSIKHNHVVSCGGGVILNPKNIKALKANGVIIFIDAPLKLLTQFNAIDRPLLKDSKSLELLYNKRYNTYTTEADIIIKKDSLDVNHILNKLVVALNDYTNLKWT
ncbi:MAG: shikimate dehydrogenase [Candidatus Izimaplasma sp.]|nr:shikimate dehydrogenase [Candidatus Izimaplasma bacterium]